MNDDKSGIEHSLRQDQKIKDLTKDISGHIEMERLLRADMANKDVLLQEISHRVLNGFHLVSSMLQLQGRRSPDESVRQQLEIAAQRVRSLALVHRRLYESAKNITSVGAKTYLTGLCQELHDGFCAGKEGHNLSLDVANDIDLPTDTMTVVGLIVAELVTNACKYAYKTDVKGDLSVSLTRNENVYRLVVSDKGVGLPSDFDIEKSRGLGMTIVKAQINELRGTLEIERAEPGTRFIVHFSV